MIGRSDIISRLWAASEFASYGDNPTGWQVVRDLIAELEQDQRLAAAQKRAAS